MLSYPSGMTVSSRALGVLSDALRAQRNQRRTRWRKLSPGRQALLVVAHLRKGETYADLACGFRIGTSTVYRYIREALELLAAMAPTLAQANQKDANTAHARRRGPGERANAELKNWRILRKIRSSPNRAGDLVAAVQALMIASA